MDIHALQAAADGQTARSKQTDNSLSGLCTEKTSRCASYHTRGSLTVEAALVFPVFIFALTAVLFLFFLVQLRTEVGRALTNAGRELSQAAYFSESAGGMGSTAAAMLYSRREVTSYLEGRTAAAMVQGGADGISFLGTVWDEETSTLTLRASFQVTLPPGLSWFHPIRVTQVRTVRGFTGFTGRSGAGETQDSDIVYVTDYGAVYHRSLRCRHLKLSISQAALADVGGMRNGDGARYYPCERCWQEGSETVFLTEEGNRYHQSLGCSSLVRGIRSVRLLDTALPPCSVCGGS